MDSFNNEYNKFKKQIKKFEIEPEEFKQLLMEYQCAILEVKTKLDVLNNEFMNNASRNPIENIKARIKSPESIYEKLERKGFEKSIDSIRNDIYDVAGIRVICPFIDDIYSVAELLTNQDDIKIISKKDYIKNPKKNGYRSLHLVVEVPVFLSSGKKYVFVEVQIRTIAMNFWASLEHQIHYKKFSNSNADAVKQLAECADTIYETDVRMLEIRKKLIDKEEEE